MGGVAFSPAEPPALPLPSSTVAVGVPGARRGDQLNPLQDPAIPDRRIVFVSGLHSANDGLLRGAPPLRGGFRCPRAPPTAISSAHPPSRRPIDHPRRHVQKRPRLRSPSTRAPRSPLSYQRRRGARRRHGPGLPAQLRPARQAPRVRRSDGLHAASRRGSVAWTPRRSRRPSRRRLTGRNAAVSSWHRPCRSLRQVVHTAFARLAAHASAPTGRSTAPSSGIGIPWTRRRAFTGKVPTAAGDRRAAAPLRQGRRSPRRSRWRRPRPLSRGGQWTRRPSSPGARQSRPCGPA